MTQVEKFQKELNFLLLNTKPETAEEFAHICWLEQQIVEASK